MKKSISFILGLIIIVSLIVISPVMAEEEDKLFTLDEIVVTATKYPVEMSETSVSVEVITEEDVDSSNAANVGELLNDVTGVNIINYGGPSGQKTVHIRGSKPTQVLILMDGQSINNNQNGQKDLGQLPLSNVKKIEILKGPASALYGANALGGVVNIITKDVSEKPEVNFKVAYGSYNTSNIKFNYSASKEKTGLIFALGKKSSDGHRNIPDNSGIDQLSFFSKINYQINNNSDLVLTFNYNDSDKEVPGMLNDSNSDGDYDDTYDSAGTPDATQNDLDKNINIKWEQNKSHSDTTVTVYSNTHEQVFDCPSTWEHSEHETAKNGVELNRTNYLDEHTIAYGLELKNNSIDSTDNGEHEFLNKAVYVHDDWKIKEALKLSMGARYDDHEQYGSEISPRVGAIYNLNSNTDIHFSAGKAYRAPTFNELYWPYADYGSWGIYSGNPDLKPEKGIAYEAGIINNKGDMKIELNLFKKDIDDMINWDIGTDGINRPYNVNSAIINGVELTFAKQLKKNLSFDINYTYLDAKDADTEEQLSGEAKHNANLGLEYSKNDYDVSVNARYVGERADESLEDYTVVNTRLSKDFRFQQRDFKVALNVNNLLNNEDYQVNKGYPMPGRNYIMEVSTKF